MTARYLKSCSARGLQSSTILAYHKSILSFLQTISNKPITQVDRDDLEDYVAHMMGQGMKATSINIHIIHVKSFLKYAAEKGWCTPTSIRQVRTQEEDIIPFTDKQLADLYDSCLLNRTFSRIRDYTLMRMLETTGMRVNECVNLPLSDIDIRNGVIALKKTKNKKFRSVFLTPTMQKELTSYLQYRNIFLKQYNLNNDYLWVATKRGRVGEVLAISTFRRNLVKYGEIAGLKGVRVSPHTFRHTFARNYLISGGDIYTLKEILGHTKLDMVLRYVRLFDLDKQTTFLKVMRIREKNTKKRI